MSKKELAEKYGKERVQWMHYFLDKINRLYGFPYSEQNLCDFIVSLSKFLKADMELALTYLEDRESTYPLKFNEIKIACNDARRIRSKPDKKHEKDTGCPIPDSIKNHVNTVLKKGK